GNPAITSALIKSLSQSNSSRLRKGAFVWDVRLKDDGAVVTYGLRDGSLHVVACKHVVFAIPQMVAVRVARNLGDKVKSTMFRFRYGSYLVANLLLNKRCFEGSFDNFLPRPSDVSDVTPAEAPYILNNTYNNEMGSVLTVYLPYDAGSPGRTILYQGNKKKIAENVMTNLLSAIPTIEGNVQEVVLTRWGHAFAVARPQYFKYVAELQNQQASNYSFAHSSAHGLPSAEAAVSGARNAANRAKGVKISAKPIYSINNIVSTACLLFVLILNTVLSASAAPATKTGSTTAAVVKRPTSNPTYWPPALNNYYPDMELIDQDGKRLRLSSLRGKIIIVEPIGMSCPACQAFAGANKPGARSYANVAPQGGLKSFEEYLSDYTGTTLASNKIVFVQLLLYSTSMQAPTVQEAQAWANTFGMKTSLNKYVLVGQQNMIGTASYNMIPGFQLIDKNFVLRSDSTGHRPQNDLYSHLFPTLKKLLNS
ncbi:MAG: FAD-dependent oxidoreductase, partial [Candidatus Obscuribacterales bacterium]|nr:FAD-dependent oxidoreductase [Candidatus Obscuribacterales bacterium]